MKRPRSTAVSGWVGCVGVLLSMCFGCSDPIIQPLQFSHKKHTDQDIECTDCHQYPETQTFSGLPTVADCMECHDTPQTDSPEEEKIRVAAKEEKELEWKRLFKVPNHVYYSHRRHVVLAGLPCERCHGDMGHRSKPPSQPPVTITMDFCIDCHLDRKVDVDCITCHR